jgi:hypothetical protein
MGGGDWYGVFFVNIANLVHNLFLVYLFLVYLSISTCFERLCAHHQEKQLCLCDTCYLHFRQSSTQNNKYQVLHKYSCFFWWWAHSCPKHVEIDKCTKNKLCTKLALFTRLYRDSRSTKRKIICMGVDKVAIMVFFLDQGPTQLPFI